MKKSVYELVTMLREDRAREVLARLAPEYAPAPGAFDPFHLARQLDQQRKTPLDILHHLTDPELRSVAMAWCKESQVNHFLSDRVELVKLLEGIVLDPVQGCP